MPVGGGGVVLLEGTFNIAATILLNDDSIELSGVGWGTILSPINNFDSDVIVVSKQHCILENFKVDGNKANQASGNGIVLDRDGAPTMIWARLNKLYIIDVKEAGIKTTGYTTDAFFSQIFTEACATGMHLSQTGATGGGGHQLVDVLFQGSSDCGLRIDGEDYMGWVYVSNFRIWGGTAAGAGTGGGIVVNFVNHLVLSDGDIDNNSGHGIEINPDTGQTVGSVLMIGIQMAQNSRDAANTYNDIYIHRTGTGAIAGIIDVTSCTLESVNTKHSVEVGDAIGGVRIYENCYFRSDIAYTTTYGSASYPLELRNNPPLVYLDKLKTGKYALPRYANWPASVAITAGHLYAMPFEVEGCIRIDRIGVEITAAAGAGDLAYVGIYKDGVNVYPGDLLNAGGTVAIDAVALVELAVNQQLVPGLYWFVILPEANCSIQSAETVYSPMGSRAANFARWVGTYDVAQAYGALPATYPVGASELDQTHLILPRIAAIDY